MLPILYSFRRCPYAIRARMALHYAGLAYELREVLLSNKPAAMLEASGKGTVPVLCLPDGQVIDESVDVMLWALALNDPDGWLPAEQKGEVSQLIRENDFGFKIHLDHYKYWDRHPQHPQSHYREQAGTFLHRLELRLSANSFLMGDKPGMADFAIFPFVRQFAFVDKAWFDQSPYSRLQLWLQYFLESSLFRVVMRKSPPWQAGDAPLVVAPAQMSLSLA
jgi:glutathione S-transferase